MAMNMTDTLRLYSAMRDEPLPEIKPIEPAKLRIAVNTFNADAFEDKKEFNDELIGLLKANGVQTGEVNQPFTLQISTIMKWEFKTSLEAYLKDRHARFKILKEIVDYYESHPDTMMKYGDVCLRSALDETPGGLLGKPYLEALEARLEAIPRIRAELQRCDAVLMTGPTNIMHFCALPSVAVAGGPKTKDGVSRAVILYGTEECRLYAAALCMERILGSLA